MSVACVCVVLLILPACLRAEPADRPSKHAVDGWPDRVQPAGGLTGKVVYVHAGHGLTAANKNGGRWSFQRGESFGMIEDLGNYDQMTLAVDYLFRAGATVVPLRPVGHQTQEVVLDNDEPAVTYQGYWTAGRGGICFGKAGGVPYRVAATSERETAVARYRPRIPKRGFYPVYAWTSSGGDRAADQLYRIHHAGGATEVTVNHRRVGNGLVYLGTYAFAEGEAGYVEISNRSSSTGSLVIADIIRFGNGMGDIDRGGGVSGQSREDEAGLYWVQWHVDRSQGIDASAYRDTEVDRQATISLAPRYARFMNRENDGRLQDRVLISFHSNAGGRGKARGVLGLVNGNRDPRTATPNQRLLAKTLAQEVNDDMVAQNGRFAHEWHDRKGQTTLDRDDIEFGELNNRHIQDEFDATIIEVGFHDNQQDAELMRDGEARDAIARATYQGLLKYFRAVDNNTTSPVTLPGAVSGMRAESREVGSVTISWTAPATNSYSGDAATGYRIDVSTDGCAWVGGTRVCDGNSRTFTVRGLSPLTLHFFRVTAVNEGGESSGSGVAAALPSGNNKDVLVVDSIGRWNSVVSENQRAGRGKLAVDRVRRWQSGCRDPIVETAQAFEAASPRVAIESTSEEALWRGEIDLGGYKAVIWLVGQASTGGPGAAKAPLEKLETFVARGGNLLVTGSAIGHYLNLDDNGRTFSRDTLGCGFRAAVEEATEVAGAAGSRFAEVPSFALDNVSACQTLEPLLSLKAGTEAEIGLVYAAGSGGAGVGVEGRNGRGNVVTLGFPLDAIAAARTRTEVVRQILAFFRRTN